MSAEFKKDFQFADQFLPRMQELIGSLLLKRSDFETDAKRATDLVLLKAGNLDIACRIRRPGFAEKYPWDFTIRLERDSGAMTEFEKIASGFADWMFYGHAAEDGASISRWFLIDLDAFRAHLILHRDQIKSGKKRNDDDGTWFQWFNIRSFPKSPPLLIAANVEVPDDDPQTCLPIDPELDKILNPAS